jgi:hypothetical protein
MATLDNLGPQFEPPKPRQIRMSNAVRESYANSKTPQSSHERLASAAERGVITPEEHAVHALGMIDHPLHPKSGTVVKGSVVKNELERE